MRFIYSFFGNSVRELLSTDFLEDSTVVLCQRLEMDYGDGTVSEVFVVQA